MKHYWIEAAAKLDRLSLRERVLIFAAVTFLLVSLLNMLLLAPLLAKQQAMSVQIAVQQNKMSASQAGIQSLLQLQREDEHSPLRNRIAELKAKIQEQNDYLQSRRERLVEPRQMAGLLEQVLKNNDKLQLVELKTLPLSLLVEAVADGKAPTAVNDTPQLYKHGVQITVRGNYLELMRYLAELERLPAQMFWGEISLKVAHHPDALLTLTVYTLSLDKTWLTV